MHDLPKDRARLSNGFQIVATEPDSSRVRLHVLGGYRIVVAGRELRLRTRKEAMVLLRLAMSAPEAVRRDELVALLWPESSEARARHSLSEALRGIEQATGLRVTRTSETLALPVEDVRLDLRELDEALSNGDVHLAGRLLLGSFLAGWYPPTAEASHWVDSVAADLRSRIERMARDQLDQRRRSTDSRGVSASVELLERLGAATEADREAAAEAEQITGWESLRAGETIQPRIPIDREGPFVGRAHEMRLLTAELERALAGELRVVLVAGEAGIGKTRTCQRLARLAALRGARLFLSSCYELEQSVAFGAISEAFAGGVTPSDVAGLKPIWQATLEEVLPDVAEVRGAELRVAHRSQGGHIVMAAMSALFEHACQRRPGLLLIDDLQWADSTSCQILHYILRSASPIAGGLIVLAFRPEDVALDEAPALLIKNAKVLGGTVIDVKSMSDDEILQQITSLCPESNEDFSRIPSLAGGSPFFARELALAHANTSPGKPTPSSLEDVVLNRVAELPPIEKAIMQFLAVAGAPVPVIGVARALQETVALTARSVASLDQRRLINENGHSVGVAHEITRNAIYSSLSDSTRTFLHALVGETFADASSSFLAHHFSAAGMAAKARTHAIAAADASRAKKAFVEELGWLLLILRNSDEDEARHALDLVVNRLFALARYSEAIKLMSEYPRILDKPLKAKLELARLKGAVGQADSYLVRLAACDSLFRECVALGMGTEAIEALREKMRLAQEAGDLNLVLSTAEDLETFGDSWPDPTEGAYARATALKKLSSFKPQAVTKGLEPLLTMKLAHDSQTAFAIGLVDALNRYNRGYVSAAATKMLQLVTSARAAGDLRDEIQMRSLLVPMSTELFRFGRAERHGRFILEYARFSDAHWDSLLTLVNLSISRLERGDIAGAKLAAAGALEAERRQPLWLIKCGARAVQVLCALESGQLKEAIKLSDEIAGVLPDTTEWFSDVSPIVVALARVWQVQGRHDAAIALLEDAAAHASERHRVCYWTISLELARLQWQTDKLSARKSIEIVRGDAANRGCRLVWHKADRLLGA